VHITKCISIISKDTERIRELTEKGKEQYEECINAYRNTIDRAWGNVQSVLDELKVQNAKTQFYNNVS
jgi:hypothetical protein